MDDYSLVEEIQKGNRAVFHQLVSKYEKRVLALTYRVTNNMEDAKDVAQEVFINAYRYIDSFQKKSKFSTWIYRIALNLSMNFVNKKSRHRTVSIEDIGITEELGSRRAVEDSRDHIEKMISEEKREHIKKAIDSLSANHRSVIILHYLEGYSCREIADILCCPLGTVISRLYYAKKLLKERLKFLLEGKEV